MPLVELRQLEAIARMHAQTMALQAVPAMVCGVFAARVTSRRLLWALLSIAFGALIVSQGGGLDAASTVLSLAYYLVVTLLFFRARHAVAAGDLRRDALFAFAFGAFVFLPANFFGTFGAIPMLAVGWHLALSVYSYGVDAGTGREDRKLGDYLFFVMVDPTTVYPERGRRLPERRGSTLVARRVVRGLCMMIAGTLLLDSLPILLEQLDPAWGGLGGTYLRAVLWSLPLFVSMYWVRAGAADLRIAWMRALGYEVGECYVRPYLSSSPLDFWRRWNLYVGHWARRYVFSPLLLALTRRYRRRAKGSVRVPVAKVSAVVLTFVCIGILHDLLNFAGESKTQFVFLQLFVFAGAGLLVWEWAVARARRHMPKSMLHRFRPVWRLWGGLLLAHYVVLMTVLSGATP